MEELEIIKKILGQFKKYKPEVAVKNILYHYLNRERHRTYGDKNPDQTIYIIRPINDKSPFYIGPVHNLLANYFYVLSHLKYAQEKGWVPVVDMLNYKVYNSQSTPINGSRNAWEYFWEQPGNVSLDEAYESRHVVLSKRSWFWEYDMGYEVKNYLDKDIVAFYSELASKTKLNAATEAHVRNAIEQYLPNGERILGINVRLGSHSVHSPLKGAGHPIAPELEDLLQYARQCAEQWHIDRLFMTSDTEFAIGYFESKFGDRLSFFPRVRAKIGTEYALDSQKNLYAPGRAFQTALDYLTEMEMLAVCDSLVGSITSGFRYAVVKNSNKYMHIEVIDKGRFEDGRKRSVQ